jgi:pimeloyl-ACP methyl ester carboxylesterase
MREEITAVTTDDGVRLNVTVYTADAGTPDPAGLRDVLLLHGWPNAGRVWRWLAEAMLTAGGYRLIAPDFRGFGASDPVASGYTCERFAADALSVAAALGLSEWALVGHSMGGKIAQLAAASRPAGLRTLCLLSPAPLVVAAPVPEERKVAQRAVRGDAERVRGLVTNMAPRLLPDIILAPLVEDGLRAAPQAWDGWIDTMRDEDHSPRVTEINVPTLVLHGAKDPLRTEEGLRADVADRIHGAEFRTLPGVGHLAHVEDPDVLALLLVNWLDSLPPTEVKTA